jgi:hypothetical protein
LLTTLEKLKQAVLEGQLDEQLTQVSNNVKARFKKLLAQHRRSALMRFFYGYKYLYEAL